MNVPQNPATTTGPIPGTAFAIATAGAFRNRTTPKPAGDTEHRQERIAFALQAVHDAAAEIPTTPKVISEKDVRELYGLPAAKPSAVDASVDRPVVIESDEWWDGYLEACEELSSPGMTAARVRSILLGISCGAVTFGVLSALDLF